jgi:hypothetical protein
MFPLNTDGVIKKTDWDIQQPWQKQEINTKFPLEKSVCKEHMRDQGVNRR